ncbi:MAG: MFS transporter [Microbacterium sp.]|nr:MFS transporter [Microbacterium sp.]
MSDTPVTETDGGAIDGGAIDARGRAGATDAARAAGVSSATDAAAPTDAAPSTTEPASDTAATELPQPRGFYALYVLSWFGLNLALGTISGVSLPKAFAFIDDATKEVNLSIVTAVGGILVMVVTPLAGRLSDRTRSRLGIRRPWILWGSVVGFGGAVVLGLATSLMPMLVGWVILQCGLGAANAAVHAMLAEQIPTRVRARISGLASAATGLGVILGAGIVAALPNESQWMWFVIPGAIGAVFTGLLYFRMNDVVRTEPRPPLRWTDVVSTYWISPRSAPDFFWAWICRLLVTMSTGFVSIYLLFFIIDRLGVSKETATGVQATGMAIFTLGALVTAVLFGWISDRTGRRKTIVWASCAISVVGLSLGMLASDIPTFLIALSIVGAAQGAFVSVDLALLTEVLPHYDDAGKDLGIVALSYQAPMFLVPALAVPVLAIGGGHNYTALFGTAIVCGVLGGLAVFPIKSVK